jgi:hypothetical protein
MKHLTIIVWVLVFIFFVLWVMFLSWIMGVPINQTLKYNILVALICASLISLITLL